MMYDEEAGPRAHPSTGPAFRTPAQDLTALEESP